MLSTKPLSPNQRRTLENAADRPTRFLLPLPVDLQARGAVRQRLLSALLLAGLAEEVPAADPHSSWRTDESGRDFALRLTAAGLTGIGRTPAVTRRKSRARPAPDTSRDSSPQPRGAEPDASAARTLDTTQAGAPVGEHPKGKLGSVLAAVSTDTGATLSELTALTGWLPHTTRAALTRLRQRGHALERTEADGRRAYRRAPAR